MKAFFIDIQGTLIDDKNFLPLPGSIEFLEYLNKKNIPFILITNNTKRDSIEFQNYLKSLGFNFKYYLDPIMVLDEVLKEKDIAVYGNEKFKEILSKKYNLEYENPKAVVLGIKKYSFEEFGDITEFLLNKAKLIGMHKTSLYARDKRYPGLGAILEMFRYATDVEYEVVGKPSINFFKKASEILGVSFDKITIISDDLKGDILPAMELGMKGILVLTGKIKSKKEITKFPDKVIEDLRKVFDES